MSLPCNGKVYERIANMGPTDQDLLGVKFRMDGGDGDRTFFDEPMDLKVVAEPWFSGLLPRGKAYLLVAQDGKFIGKYFAITSRQVATIPEQLEWGKLVSVVVHEVKNPGSEFRTDSLVDARAFGMAVIERLP